MKFSKLYGFLHALEKDERQEVDEFYEKGGYQIVDKDILLVYRFLAEYHGPFDEQRFTDYLERHNINRATAQVYSDRISTCLIETVVRFRADKDPLFTIQKHISQARLLRQSERFDLAEEELNKADELEQIHRFPSARHDIEMLTMLLLYQKGVSKTTEAVKNHCIAVRQAVSDLAHESEIHLLYHSVFDYRLYNENEDAAWLEIEQAYANRPLPEPCNPDLRYAHTMIGLKIAYRKRQVKQILAAAEKQYQVFNQDDFCRTHYPLAYISAIDTYLNALGMNDMSARMATVIDDLKQLEFALQQHRTKQLATIIFHEMHLIRNNWNGSFAMSATQVERLKIRFEACEDALLPTRRLTTHLGFALFFFFRFDYARAQEHLSEIVAHDRNDLRSDYQRVKLIVTLIIQLEDRLQLPEDIERSIRNLQNRFNKWGKYYPEEKKIIALCRKWNNSAKGRRNLIPIFQKYHDQLVKISGPPAQRRLDADTVIRWLELKIADKTWS